MIEHPGLQIEDFRKEDLYEQPKHVMGPYAKLVKNGDQSHNLKLTPPFNVH